MCRQKHEIKRTIVRFYVGVFVTELLDRGTHIPCFYWVEFCLYAAINNRLYACYCRLHCGGDSG